MTIWTEYLFKSLQYSIYVLYVLIYLGLWSGAPTYLEDFNYYMKVFVGIVLLYVFNPFYSMPYKSIHKDIAFTAGLIIITTTSLNAFQQRILNTYSNVKEVIIPSNSF